MAESRSDTRLTHQVLDNGIEVLGQFIPGVESAAAMFWVKTGGRDESARESGISHFLEHMAFKRSSTRTYVEFNREFEEIGAEYNAFTSNEMTAYHAKVLAEELPTCIDLLADLTHPQIDDTDFDEERRVILEEIARHNDQPYSLLFDQFFQNYYRGHGLGQPVLGTADSIQALASQDMRNYWDRRYTAGNMIFSVAGNFNWENVLEQLSQVSSTWHTGVPAGANGVSPPSPKPIDSVIADDRWNQEHLIVARPAVERGDPRYYTSAILANILGDNSGSRLFWALNQSGLCDQVGADSVTFSDSGVLMTIAVTSPEKAPKALAVLREELSKLQHGDIELDELDRARMKLLTSTVLEGESTNARMMGLIDSWLSQGRLETLDEVQAAIEAVTLEDIRNYLDEFPLDQEHSLVALGPLNREQLESQ
jgi:predicted Zn-dependent peptidase